MTVSPSPYLPRLVISRRAVKTRAYDVTVRRIATGADFTMRLFAVDADRACMRAKECARFAIGMRQSEYNRIESAGIAVFRVVSCEVSVNQSRPIAA